MKATVLQRREDIAPQNEGWTEIAAHEALGFYVALGEADGAQRIVLSPVGNTEKANVPLYYPVAGYRILLTVN
jgi:hypothetical protein